MAKSKLTKSSTLPAGYTGIHGDIVALLDTARHAAARSVNALMTASYWEVGRRIVEAEQKGRRRAGYGEQLIARLSDDLTAEFGRGFSRQNLQQMRSFFLTWPICQTVSGKSSVMPAQARLPRLDDAAADGNAWGHPLQGMQELTRQPGQPLFSRNSCISLKIHFLNSATAGFSKPSGRCTK